MKSRSIVDLKCCFFYLKTSILNWIGGCSRVVHGFFTFLTQIIESPFQWTSSGHHRAFKNGPWNNIFVRGGWVEIPALQIQTWQFVNCEEGISWIPITARFILGHWLGQKVKLEYYLYKVYVALSTRSVRFPLACAICWH